jgi:signal transduction histidine kinase
VRQIAEAHGGSASVEPAPGGGSVFRLRLRALERREPITPKAVASA